MGFSKQEYWSRLPCPPSGDLPDPGIEPGSPTLQVDSLLFGQGYPVIPSLGTTITEAVLERDTDQDSQPTPFIPRCSEPRPLGLQGTDNLTPSLSLWFQASPQPSVCSELLMSSKTERFKFHLLLIFPPTPCQKCLHAENSLRGKMARRRAAGEKHHRFYCQGESGRPAASADQERGKAPGALLHLGLIWLLSRCGVISHDYVLCFGKARGPFLQQYDGDFPGSLVVKNPPANTGDMGGEVGYSPWGCKGSDTTEQISIAQHRELRSHKLWGNERSPQAL